MKLKTALADLNAALDRVSTVKPMNGKQVSAYVFTFDDGQCYVHSQDSQGYVRTRLPCDLIEDPSTFVYPADRVEALKYLKGWIEIEAGNEDSRYWVKYRTEGGARADRGSYNPKDWSSFESNLAWSHEYQFPTSLLREAVNITSKYLASSSGSSSDSNQHYQILQLFDPSKKEWANGNGTLYAADSLRACYFYCEAFKDKGFTIHEKHVSRLTSFLGKCGKSVTLRIGKSMSFVLDEESGSTFGWVLHTKTHPAYKYYPAKHDKFVMLVPKDIVLETLYQIRSEIKDLKRDKIRLQYSDKSLRFVAGTSQDIAETVPVGVKPLETDVEGKAGSDENFSANVSVNYLIGLFEGAKSNEVELRVAFLNPEANEKALFRTVERFWLNESGKVVIPSDSKETCYECRVTHFTPSKE